MSSQTHEVNVTYERRKLKVKPGSVKGQGGDAVNFNYLTDRDVAATFTFFAWGKSTGANPFAKGTSSFTIDPRKGTKKKNLRLGSGLFEYRINVDGNVIDPVVIIEPRLVKIRAKVDGIDPAASLGILGLTIRIDETTSFYEDSGELATFDFGRINPGDCLEIRGEEEPPESGVILARIIEQKALKTQVELEGTVASAAYSDSDLVILGITIDTEAAEYFNADLHRIDCGDFFGQAVGEQVFCIGSWNGSVLTATRVELR